MRYIFDWFLTLIILTVAAWGIFGYSSWCNQTFTYKIGQIDERFMLPEAAVKADVTEAAQLWNSSMGKNLFGYSDKGNIEIDFQYDERTALNSQINNAKDKLDENNSSLQQQLDKYNADVTDYEKRLANFNARVNKYNAQGGAPPDIYEQMMQEQKSLQQEGNTLNVRAAKLNQATRSYNLNVEKLNGEVNTFNNALGQKPEEGVYDPNTDKITIYFATDRQELVHTLAHELGHAIGMDHAQDEKAIMNQMSSSNLVVTPDDKAMLDNVCREQRNGVIWYMKLQKLIRQWIYKI